MNTEQAQQFNKNYKKNATRTANRAFKNNANKSDSNIQSIIFLCFGLVVIFLIFVFVKLINYGDSHINDVISLYNNLYVNTDSNIVSEVVSYTSRFTRCLGLLGIMLIILFGGLMVFQMSIGETPDMANLAWSLTRVGIPIIGFTMMVIYNLPLMLRAFENTFGYAWISLGSKLRTMASNLFEKDSAAESYNDYSVIATQLYEENYAAYLMSMRKENDGISRFKDVFLKSNHLLSEGSKLNLLASSDKGDNPVYEMLKLVVQKRYISEAAWLSLAALLTMYSTYLLI